MVREIEVFLKPGRRLAGTPVSVKDIHPVSLAGAAPAGLLA